MAELGSSPYINHFIQPDSIIPNQSDPRSWNRYSYANNNPLKYTDPSGHRPCEDYQGVCLSETQVTKVYESNLQKIRGKSKDKNKPAEPTLQLEIPDVIIIDIKPNDVWVELSEALNRDNSVTNFQDALGDEIYNNWVGPLDGATQYVLDEIVLPSLGLSEPSVFTTSLTESVTESVIKPAQDLIHIGVDACNTPGVPSCGDVVQNVRYIYPRVPAINPRLIDTLLTACVVLPGCLPP